MGEASSAVESPSIEDVDPEDAEAFVQVSAALVDGASKFHMTFVVYETEEEDEDENEEGEGDGDDRRVADDGDGDEHLRIVPGSPDDHTSDSVAEASLGEGEAVYDEAESRWISEAEVAETTITLFVSKKKSAHVTCRLIVRRVKRLNPAAAPGQATCTATWRN
jgi:hypothetical protein